MLCTVQHRCADVQGLLKRGDDNAGLTPGVIRLAEWCFPWDSNPEPMD